jgi:hypothetical protein
MSELSAWIETKTIISSWLDDALSDLESQEYCNCCVNTEVDELTGKIAALEEVLDLMVNLERSDSFLLRAIQELSDIEGSF